MNSARGPRLALLLGVVLFGAACVTTGDERSTRSASDSDRRHQGLLTAYMLLEDTLSQEAKLDWLALLKTITFRSPVPEIKDLMERIADTSDERLDELAALRTLPPDVSADPDYTDPIGDAITGYATESGMDEMLDLQVLFGTRFILLQAQATRMISAISRAAADRETNEQRRKWLLDLAAEYESIRDEFVVVIADYVLQRGEAQQAED